MTGRTFGTYQLGDKLGAGGMGEVYRARDPRLNRDVALKILPAGFATDEDRLKRFEHEARTVGALSHPNIVTIFELGVEGGTPFIAMELVQGGTLRERLMSAAAAGHGLAPRKAIDFATQIAHGLAAAHEHGVVHRDLKPENIIVTPDGRLKILDFGLAKAADARAAGMSAESLETGFAPATAPGTVMGTVGYMAPEQVRAEASVDHRADIFALGAILYEMLSGTRAFHAGSAVETMSAIVKDDPADVAQTAADIPPGLARLVHRCLEKSPAERYQSARDLAFHLAALSADTGHRSGIGDTPAIRGHRSRALPIVAASIAGAIAGLAIAWFALRPAALEPTRFETFTYSGVDTGPAASPDGRTLAFSSSRTGQPRIWLRQLDGGGERALTAGPDDRVPRFSPDGTYLIFLRREGDKVMLVRTAVQGGEDRRLLNDVASADWSPDGSSIVFVTARGQTDQVIGIIRADGSGRRDLRTVKERTVVGVRWSPDGQSLVTVDLPITGTTSARVEIMSASGGEPRALRDPAAAGILSMPVWTKSSSEIVYASDPAGLQMVMTQSGHGTRMVAHNVRTDTVRTLFWTLHPSNFADIVAPGVLAFDSLQASSNLRAVSLGRTPGTTTQDSWLTRGSSIDRQPAISPDGNSVLFASSRNRNLDLWVLSRRDGALQRLTDDAAADWDPAWTPDGKGIIWSSNRGGNFEIWTAAADGSGARQVTHDGVDAENPAMTPDGQSILHWSANPAKVGIWKVRIDGSDAKRLVTGVFNAPEISPDGLYFAVSEAPQGEQRLIRVFRVADGTPVSFTITVERNGSIDPNYSRNRWMPGGKAIAFIGNDTDGQSGVFVQDFVPGQDTRASRRRLAGFIEGIQSESFGIARDGSLLVLAGFQLRSDVILAHDIPNLMPGR